MFFVRLTQTSAFAGLVTSELLLLNLLAISACWKQLQQGRKLRTVLAGFILASVSKGRPASFLQIAEQVREVHSLIKSRNKCAK